MGFRDNGEKLSELAFCRTAGTNVLFLMDIYFMMCYTVIVFETAGGLF